MLVLVIERFWIDHFSPVFDISTLFDHMKLVSGSNFPTNHHQIHRNCSGRGHHI